MTTTRPRAGHLGEFLRARRAQVRPEEHGLPPGGRRTPGLRREEVAVLAGVSLDYYIRLEQGRERHPSPQVLTALAGALRLGDEALDYLCGLAGAAPAGRPPARGGTAGEGLIALMNAWPDTPALVYDRYMDVLATNDLGAALFSWLRDERNVLRAIFLLPQARTFYREWARIAEGCVAALRTENRDPGEPGLVALVEELSAASPEFDELYRRQHVRPKTAAVKLLCHPLVGPLDLSFENLTVASAPGQHLVAYHAREGSPEASALARLRAGRVGASGPPRIR